MNLFQKVLELDLAYLDTFTRRETTSWGYILHNEAQPTYYDANHAHIHEAPQNPRAVIEEVIQFYQERNIIPRFYLYNLEKLDSFIKELDSYKFGFEELVSPIQIWNKEITEYKGRELVTIEKVTNENFNEALEIECSIKEFGGREVREKAFPEEFNHPAFTHYLLRYDGESCATACIFEHGDQARMESVATKEEFRGKGLIGELIYFLQAEVKSKGIEDFWVFPINEKIEKVYAKYGFHTTGKFITGHAFLGGKSIKEIQEG
ncbi:GNAT family N-acetyltransferase [Neobacillus sp. MM2021_6]|uniref:GNAT family N-acetyltransferase n=1 Tax=Bacillaceae TaxID=186817 RepID=UPI001409F6FE|nr:MULTISPECIES: GNAT family N-acetyltransferase [Bacillaceae]MBO0959710.1 GNAT family N-acetyltransferase [Neobacillus sp. MM2021_6]NHC19210.1 GNAT family N-acetyltransferase [Bacillus sp. MM2020_4]WML38268.1 GNAT family N-acetyltransferase [Neobacillus sp. OS1-2]